MSLVKQPLVIAGREFRSRLRPGCQALFFYAGHGLQVSGINYLPAVDADISAEDDVPSPMQAYLQEVARRAGMVFLAESTEAPETRWQRR